jgi:hypothetical protein
MNERFAPGVTCAVPRKQYKDCFHRQESPRDAGWTCVSLCFSQVQQSLIASMAASLGCILFRVPLACEHHGTHF